ncbi:putative isochorismatase family protein YddQ [Geobacter sp. OR-1]|uniref:cysteine hydrolase family protein n=1 Tax=Geobacter sp. OR-1 TaxID=1266765 RepID=UPI000542F2CC|nr:cysteine hydrolase family protein [Geobacter sp. OR-1]GAM10402.1 putative isochorismatase family protein YddQ [Geobacter sp. OR-1]
MKTALLIIDNQNDYFPGGKMELVGSVQAAAAALRLLSAFRKQSWPVYHVQHISMQPGATFFLPDTEGAAIHKSVAPLPTEPVITKHFPSSFRDTSLLEQLKADKIGTLLICGMMSHMCVDTTVRAAFDLGFSCIVTHDACATRDLSFNGVTVPAAQVHASYMAALGAVFAQVKGVEEILENISSTV